MSRSLRQKVYYCPLTKFAKVMFLHLSVSHSVHGGQCLPQYMLGYTPTTSKADTPWSRHLPGADTPQEQTPPRSRPPPREQTPQGADTPPPKEQTPPCTVHAGRYGQQAGGTHPTGMHTCLIYFC